MRISDHTLKCYEQHFKEENMKGNVLRVALESLKGSVSKKFGPVEITGATLLASNDTRWAEVMLPESISTPMSLPYLTLHRIVTMVPEDAELKIEKKGSTCFIQCPPDTFRLDLFNESEEIASFMQSEGFACQLNIANSTYKSPPKFEETHKIVASGRTLIQAHKALKHLILPFLSRPGLKWVWTNDESELVIGDGPRLGGYRTGTKDLELPVPVLSEICRILAVSPSETVLFQMGEKFIRTTIGDTHFQATLPSGPRFEIDWYRKVRDRLTEEPQLLKLSRLDLLSAVKRVKITAGEPTARFTTADGKLALESRDAHDDTCDTRVEASGTLRGPVTLNIEHLESALEALTDESVVFKVCKSAVEVSDEKGWEVIMQR